MKDRSRATPISTPELHFSRRHGLARFLCDIFRKAETYGIIGLKSRRDYRTAASRLMPTGQLIAAVAGRQMAPMAAPEIAR